MSGPRLAAADFLDTRFGHHGETSGAVYGLDREPVQRLVPAGRTSRSQTSVAFAKTDYYRWPSIYVWAADCTLLNPSVSVRTPLLPLNRPRRLARHVIHHPVDALHLVDDPRRGGAEKTHVERIEIRGHAVGRGHRAQAHDVFIGLPVAHHADGFYWQLLGEGLPDLVVEAGFSDLVDIDIIRV